MKNRLITGIVFVVLGLLIAVGPQTLFPVCAPMEMPMKCYWSGRVEIAIGALIAVAGLLLLAFSKKQVRFGISLLIGFNGITALLIPTVLVGVCGASHMDCRKLTLPALTILSSLVIAFSVVNAIYLYITDKGGNTYDEKQTSDNRPSFGI